MEDESDERFERMQGEITALRDELERLRSDLESATHDGGRFHSSGGVVTLKSLSFRVEDALQEIGAIRRTLGDMHITIGPTRVEMAQQGKALERDQAEAAKRNE